MQISSFAPAPPLAAPKLLRFQWPREVALRRSTALVDAEWLFSSTSPCTADERTATDGNAALWRTHGWWHGSLGIDGNDGMGTTHSRHGRRRRWRCVALAAAAAWAVAAWAVAAWAMAA